MPKAARAFTTARTPQAARNYLIANLGEQAMLSGLLAFKAGGTREVQSRAHDLRALRKELEDRRLPFLAAEIKRHRETSTLRRPDNIGVRLMGERLSASRPTWFILDDLTAWVDQGLALHAEVFGLTALLGPSEGHFRATALEQTQAQTTAVVEWLERCGIKRDRGSWAAHLEVAAGNKVSDNADWTSLVAAWRKKLSRFRSFEGVRKRRARAEIGTATMEFLALRFAKDAVDLLSKGDRKGAVKRYGAAMVADLEAAMTESQRRDSNR